MLEQSVLEHVEHGGPSSRACFESLEYAQVCSSRASTVVPLLEHAEHKSMLCSSMLVHNTTSNPKFGFEALL